MAKVPFRCPELPPGVSTRCEDFTPSYETSDKKDYDQICKECEALQANEDWFRAAGCKREGHYLIPGGRTKARAAFPDAFPREPSFKNDPANPRHRPDWSPQPTPQGSSPYTVSRLAGVADQGQPYPTRTQSPRTRGAKRYSPVAGQLEIAIQTYMQWTDPNVFVVPEDPSAFERVFEEIAKRPGAPRLTKKDVRELHRAIMILTERARKPFPKEAGKVPITVLSNIQMYLGGSLRVSRTEDQIELSLPISPTDYNEMIRLAAGSEAGRRSGRWPKLIGISFTNRDRSDEIMYRDADGIERAVKDRGAGAVSYLFDESVMGKQYAALVKEEQWEEPFSFILTFSMAGTEVEARVPFEVPEGEHSKLGMPTPGRPPIDYKRFRRVDLAQLPSLLASLASRKKRKGRRLRALSSARGNPLKAPSVNFDLFKDMPKQSVKEIPGQPGWVVYRDRHGIFSVHTAAKAANFITYKKDQSGEKQKTRLWKTPGGKDLPPPEKYKEETLPPPASSPQSEIITEAEFVRSNPNMSRKGFTMKFPYERINYEQEMGAYPPSSWPPVNQRNPRKVSKSPKAQAWRAKFGEISHLARSIQQATPGCTFKQAWDAAAKQVGYSPKSKGNPYRKNAGRHVQGVLGGPSVARVVKGKDRSKYKLTEYAGPRPLSAYRTSDLVAQGTPEALAELARRGRGPDGERTNKPAWLAEWKAKKAKGNPWGWFW